MDTTASLEELAAATPALRVLFLYGSRARGEARATSDWDFAYLADASFDPMDFASRLSGILQTDDVDLTNLESAGGLLRHRVATEGQLLFRRTQGDYEGFVLDAVRFWFDAGPTILRSQEAVLRGLP